MKKTILAAALVTLLAGATKAQFIDKSEVPETVNKSFATAYSSVEGGVWEKEGKKFKVTFKTDTVSHTVAFDDAGKAIFHQYTIPVTTLSKEVVNGGSKTYPDLALAAADKIEDNGKTYYILSYKNGDSPLKVQVSEKGLVMKVFDAE